MADHGGIPVRRSGRDYHDIGPNNVFEPTHVAFPKDEAAVQLAVIIACDQYAGAHDSGDSEAIFWARIKMFAVLNDLAKITVDRQEPSDAI